MGNENVIIRGERGSSSIIEFNIKSTNVDDLLLFAETIGKKYHLLVGEKTDRKNWTSCIG